MAPLTDERRKWRQDEVFKVIEMATKPKAPPGYHDVFSAILTHCHWSSLQSFALLADPIEATQLKERIFSVINQRKPSETTTFIDHLIQGLSQGSHPEQLTALHAIRKDLRDEKTIFSTLSGFKEKSLTEKNRIIDILKTIDITTLNSLSEIPIPDFFGNILEVSKMLAESTHTPRIPRAALDLRLSQISLDLLEIGETERALEVVTQIPDLTLNKDLALERIGLALFNEGNLNQAANLTNMIFRPSKKENVFRTIVSGLINTYPLEQVIEKIRLTNNPTFSDHALYLIVTKFSNKSLEIIEMIKISIKIASTLEEPVHKRLAFEHILTTLIENTTREETLPIIYELFDPLHRDEALENVAIDAAKKDALEVAIEIAHTISCPKTKQHLLKNINKMRTS
jgi:hypothetical protein